MDESPANDASARPVDLVGPVTDWYTAAARDLPWRRADATPWAVLVSEVMLQQTPVARVLPAYARWLSRWPTASDLALDSPGEAVRAWDRLGYPRRALRLHAAAVAIVARHGGEVPSSYLELRALPGIGDYTAAAVAAFAFGQRHAVLDTNVRRVLARAVGGLAGVSSAVSVAERARAVSLLPDDEKLAARFSVALMELGALVCRSRAPDCSACPIVSRCAWHSAGAPSNVVASRSQAYAGTDRQVRGRLLAVLRSSREPVARSRLDLAWPDAAQRVRALDGLVADGLVSRLSHDEFCLPA